MSGLIMKGRKDGQGSLVVAPAHDQHRAKYFPTGSDAIAQWAEEIFFEKPGVKKLGNN